MRRLVNTLVTVFLAASAPAEVALASGEPDPVCLAGGDSNSLRCEFASFGQCRATAFGGLGYCVNNPASLSNAFAKYRRDAKRAY
jgi:hypothetical protein